MVWRRAGWLVWTGACRCWAARRRVLRPLWASLADEGGVGRGVGRRHWAERASRARAKLDASGVPDAGVPRATRQAAVLARRMLGAVPVDPPPAPCASGPTPVPSAALQIHRLLDIAASDGASSVTARREGRTRRHVAARRGRTAASDRHPGAARGRVARAGCGRRWTCRRRGGACCGRSCRGGRGGGRRRAGVWPGSRRRLPFVRPPYVCRRHPARTASSAS